jgi:hypothetical protein
MDSIKKEQVVAGVIGGFTALALAYIARKYVFRRKCGKEGRWGPA